MTALPAGPLLFDTGIYIRFSRGENYLWLGEDARIFQRTILTAVVAAELYAGTHDHREKRALDELCQAYRALGHFSSPSTPAWVDTGILLRRARRDRKSTRLNSSHGYISYAVFCLKKNTNTQPTM